MKCRPNTRRRWLQGRCTPRWSAFVPSVELVREEVVNGGVRRSYGLTPPGASALRAGAERMAETARLVIGPSHGLKAVRGAGKATPA